MLAARSSLVNHVCREGGLMVAGNARLDMPPDFICVRSHTVHSRVIVKSGVSVPELGGDLVYCFHLDSIFEFYSGNDLCQVVESA
jgi:hypothetical protein